VSAFRADATRLADDAVLLALHGTLGALDVDDLRAAAETATAERLVVDATDVRIDDPGALEVLLDLAREASPTGVVAVVAPAGGELERVLLTTGLEAAFSLYPDLPAALDDLDLPSRHLR
jgi:anti-anti-sigma regulatory factor